MHEAKVTEIFSSLQGEGIYAGIRQIFIRFYGCNISSCRFCDTPLASYQTYTAAALRDAVLGMVDRHHSIALTGGEPLVQKDFLKSFIPLLKMVGQRTYLETNGTLPRALEETRDFFDTIAMDFKLPSSTGLQDFWEAHRLFLEKAAGGDIFVKAVITKTTVSRDIMLMRDIIAAVNSGIPLVLQPVTPAGGVDVPGREALHTYQDLCRQKLRTVKIVPQLHKLVGIK